MYRPITLEEDLALKKVIAQRRSGADSNHHFNWREVLSTEQRTPVPEIIVTRKGEDQEFSLADVADTIGEALTDLLLSRSEAEDRIFNDDNRRFVSGVAFNVAKSLMAQVQRGGHLKLSQNDLYLLIEKALIENDAHDVAKSLVFNRSWEKTGEIVVSEEPHPMPVRLIRRNGNVVPWSETKIETAVRNAFLSQREDPAGASVVAHGVTQRVRHGDSAFVHIEDVQDLVQEELMRQGFFKVAESYILYRAERARMREVRRAELAEDPNQES
ncbi:MAG: ribonucleoside-diphosphate reductase subunit alpha, partial [Akkermansiaceae bacterium]|nr:ribonucleoside-diphosphate reductase subunit alpha [Akkermansiaceae bacterium]